MIIIGAHEAVYPMQFVRVRSVQELEELQGKMAVDSGAHGQGQGEIITETIAESINETIAETIAWFGYDLALAARAKSLRIPFAMRVGSVGEFLMGAYFLPRFMIVDSGARVYQELADSYVLDSKVLQVISSCEEIERYAGQGIDGVVLAHMLGE